MALVDVWLLALTVVSVSVGLVSVVLVSRGVRRLSRQAQEAVGAMSSAVERALYAVRTIRASGATAREVAGVGDSARRSYEAGVRVARLEAMVSPIGSIAVQGAFLAVLGVGGYRVASGSITVASLVAFILYLFLLVMPLGRMIGAWTQLQTGLGALSRIQEILALPPEDDEHPDRPPARTAGSAAAPLRQLDDVSFAYADGTQVLFGVSLQ